MAELKAKMQKYKQQPKEHKAAEAEAKKLGAKIDKESQYCGEDGKDRCCISCKQKASAGQPPSVLKYFFKTKKKSVCTAAECKVDDRCRSTRGKIAYEDGPKIVDGPHQGKPVFSTCRHTLSWDGCMSGTHTNCAVAGYDAVAGMF